MNSLAVQRQSSNDAKDRSFVGEPIEQLLRASQKPISIDEVSLLVRSLEENITHFPLPGRGKTLSRWRALAALGAFDLSVAKLLESHFDALAIMDEARFIPKPGVYGVWASKFEGRFLSAKRSGDLWRVSGDLAFASGISTVEFAIVPVKTESGEQLFEIPRSAVTATDRSRWNTPGMVQADTAWISVDALLPDSSRVGEIGFYLDRPGFWAGAIGVAACWLGGAQALFQDWQKASRLKTYADAHDEAHRAQVFSALKACATYLKFLGPLVDDRMTSHEVIHREALTFRHLVDKACSDLLHHSLTAMGPVLLIKDSEHSKRFMDLQIFIRQCHAEKDLVQLSKVLNQTDFQGEWF